MTKLISRHRVGGPYPPNEVIKRTDPPPPSREDDEKIDFGFGGGDYDDVEEDGPPFEPPLADPELENSSSETALASPLPKKPLRKPLVRIASAESTSPIVQDVTPPQTVMKGSKSERSQLSCQLSRDHHRRLKIHSIMTGKSILSVLEGWIEEHCPQL